MGSQKWSFCQNGGIMPELPEVETVAARLQTVLPGKKFAQIKTLHPKSFAGDISQILESTITQVNRRAKFINIHLDNNLHLLAHLKMTGQIIYVAGNNIVGGGHPTADWVQNLPGKHTRIIYEFVDKSKLFFNDQRIFGWMRIVSKSELEQIFSKYGEDVNKLHFDSAQKAQVIKKINKSRRAIKQVILDQQIIAGLGNIYACEALYLAKIDPQRPANTLSESEISNLLKHSAAIVNQAIKFGGTTFDGKYVGADGESGNFQNQLQVYGREGQACLRCGNLIKKIKQGGRGTFYCEECQV